MNIQAKHIVVQGRVQGVGFRNFVRNAGVRLGLTGDVRNLPDGSVEIFVEGAANAVATLVGEVSRGPLRARVEHVAALDAPVRGACRSFTVEGR